MSSPTTDMVGSYLKEIGRYPLLTPDQEIAYARLVQQMIAIEGQRSSLVQQLNRQPTDLELATSQGLTEAEIKSIVLQGQKAKQKMVTAKERLVVAIAKKYQNRNLEFLDLIQEGALGLQRGIEKFDPNKGYKLSTYAKGVDYAVNNTCCSRKVSQYSPANSYQRKTEQNQESTATTVSIFRSSSGCDRNCRILESIAKSYTGIPSNF